MTCYDVITLTTDISVCFDVGINQEALDTINFTTKMSVQKDSYNELIVDKLIKIITLCSQFGRCYTFWVDVPSQCYN